MVKYERQQRQHFEPAVSVSKRRQAIHVRLRKQTAGDIFAIVESVIIPLSH